MDEPSHQNRGVGIVRQAGIRTSMKHCPVWEVHEWSIINHGFSTTQKEGNMLTGETTSSLIANERQSAHGTKNVPHADARKGQREFVPMDEGSKWPMSIN